MIAASAVVTVTLAVVTAALSILVLALTRVVATQHYALSALRVLRDPDACEHDWISVLAVGHPDRPGEAMDTGLLVCRRCAVGVAPH